MNNACLLLACLLGASGSLASTQKDKPVSGSASSIDNEYFEIGFNTGILNLQDFSSEFTVGANVSFKATEDFFLQFNYLRTDVGLSSFEKDSPVGRYFEGDDRTYSHYDLLVGYNLLQGEFFFREGEANLSTLYLVAGVGDTEFGGEANFTYTLGAGYEVSFARRFVMRFDYRNFIYTSNLIVEEDGSTRNGLLSVGLGYLF
ncbi:MAG: outer membrane beta-barrel domain-containing protein [Cellvibrionaceae bacterium]|nr:outer membrane beta-barrel domain-containing protein [Cellvibrionaceae bacterium]